MATPAEDDFTVSNRSGDEASADFFFENKFKCENFPVADHDAVDVLFISFLPLHSNCVEWYGLARTNL